MLQEINKLILICSLIDFERGLYGFGGLMYYKYLVTLEIVCMKVFLQTVR